MNFHYHPILGLQWSCGDESFLIDINALPEISVAEFLKLWHQQGCMIRDATPHEIISTIQTNAWLN